MQKKLLIIGVVTFVLMGGVVFVLQKKQSEKQGTPQKTEREQEVRLKTLADLLIQAEETNPPEVDTTEWKTYSDEESGVKFSYPSEFKVNSERNDDIEFSVLISPSANAGMELQLSSYYSDRVTGNLQMNIDLFGEAHKDYKQISNSFNRGVFIKDMTDDAEQVSGVIIFSRDIFWFSISGTQESSSQELAAVIKGILLSFEQVDVPTLSQDVVLYEVKISEDESISIRIRDDLDLVVLSDAGNETIIDGSERNKRMKPKSSVYKDLDFSLGRYIQYHAYGWEWSSVKLYDTKEKKRIIELESNFQNGFTVSGDYFYACTVNQFGGALYANIYTLPQFEKRYDFFEENKQYSKENILIDELGCTYEKNKNILKISVSYFNVDEVGKDAYLEKYKKNEIFEYSFNSESLKKVQ